MSLKFDLRIFENCCVNFFDLNNYSTALLYYLSKFGFGTYMGFGNMIHETVSGRLVEAKKKQMRKYECTS